ncbi:Uncharacterized protein GBIM_19333, partial [Gryllus bimaculatus]
MGRRVTCYYETPSRTKVPSSNSTKTWVCNFEESGSALTKTPCERVISVRFPEKVDAVQAAMVERYVNQWKEISSGYGAILDSETSLERERLRFLVFAEVHLHTARQRVWAPAYKSFVAKRGWPLADRYSSLVQRLVDGGVVRLLADRANRALLRFHRQATAFYSPPAGPVELSMRHFADAFVALACGLAAATAALAAEVARRPPAVRPRVAR